MLYNNNTTIMYKIQEKAKKKFFKKFKKNLKKCLTNQNVFDILIIVSSRERRT